VPQPPAANWMSEIEWPAEGGDIAACVGEARNNRTPPTIRARARPVELSMNTMFPPPPLSWRSPLTIRRHAKGCLVYRGACDDRIFCRNIGAQRVQIKVVRLPSRPQPPHDGAAISIGFRAEHELDKHSCIGESALPGRRTQQDDALVRREAVEVAHGTAQVKRRKGFVAILFTVRWLTRENSLGSALPTIFRTLRVAPPFPWCGPEPIQLDSF
jgi:hypothetical protein